MRSWSNGKRPLALALTVFTLHASPLACASRAVPARFPPTSAASTAAPAARAAVLDSALVDEPPLPGQPATAWPGLQPGGAINKPSRHGGHHGH